MRNFIFINTFLAFCFLSNSSFAQFNKQDFKDYTEKFADKVIKISASKLSDQKKVDELITIIDESIDLKWISRFVLGKHYKTFSISEFQRFLELYRKYMINTYATKFSSYKGKKFLIKDIKFQKIFYLADTEFYSVDSNVPILVSFRLKKRGDKIYIIDFIPEGISLLESQRSELDSAISSNGVGKFLDDLKKKVE